jgi:hypothetical protein
VGDNLERGGGGSTTGLLEEDSDWLVFIFTDELLRDDSILFDLFITSEVFCVGYEKELTFLFVFLEFE